VVLSSPPICDLTFDSLFADVPIIGIKSDERHDPAMRLRSYALHRITSSFGLDVNILDKIR